MSPVRSFIPEALRFIHPRFIREGGGKERAAAENAKEEEESREGGPASPKFLGLGPHRSASTFFPQSQLGSKIAFHSSLRRCSNPGHEKRNKLEGKLRLTLMQTSRGVARVLNPARVVVLKAPSRSVLLLRRPPSSSSSSSTSYRRARIAVRKSTSMTGGSISHRSKPSPSSTLLLRQLFEKDSSTYTYLLADVGHPDRPAVVSRSISPPLSFHLAYYAMLYWSIDAICV